MGDPGLEGFVFSGVWGLTKPSVRGAVHQGALWLWEGAQWQIFHRAAVGAVHICREPFTPLLLAQAGLCPCTVPELSNSQSKTLNKSQPDKITSSAVRFDDLDDIMLLKSEEGWEGEGASGISSQKPSLQHSQTQSGST